jgi:predicted secreted protein
MIAAAFAALVLAQATMIDFPYRDNPSCGATFDAIVTEAATSASAHAGSRFVVALASNPSTGYGWRMTSAPVDAAWAGRQYVADVAHATPPPAPAEQPRLMPVGGGGTDLWLFTATAPGTAKLTFGLYPPGRKTSVQNVAITVAVVPAVPCPASAKVP